MFHSQNHVNISHELCGLRRRGGVFNKGANTSSLYSGQDGAQTALEMYKTSDTRCGNRTHDHTIKGRALYQTELNGPYISTRVE